MKRFLTAIYLLLAVSAAGQNMTLKPGATIKFQDADASHSVGIKGPGAVSNNINFTLPNADGAAGEVLTTDGSGGWYWSAGGGGGGGVADGDKGDIIVSSSATVWTLDTGVVGLSQLGLLDPNVDRILFWDDSAGALTHLGLGSGLSISGTTLNVQTVTDGDKGDITVSGSGAVWGIDSGAVGVTELGLVDPNADRIMFWDDSAGTVAFLAAGTGLSISGTTITNTMIGGDLNMIEEDGAGSDYLRIFVGSTLSATRELHLFTPDIDMDVTLPNSGTWTVAGSTIANAWGDGVKQTFNPNASNAGVNVGGHTADPLSLANGDIWYNSNTNELKARINGTSVALGAGGGSGNVTKVGTPVNNQVGVWTGDGTLEGDAAFTFDTATDTLTVPNLTVTTLNTTNLNANGFFLVEEEGAGTQTVELYAQSSHTANRRLGIAIADADIEVTFPISMTVAGTTVSNSWADGVKQTFNPNGTNAGLNVGSHTADPSSPANGDLWYDSTANELTARINGANVALGSGGASTGSFGITVDGGGTVLTSGSKGFVIVPFACTITGWSLVADQSGSVAFDVEKAADGNIPSTSIVASAAPALSADQIERSTTLTGWTTSVTANDVIEFEVTGSPATITRATLQIHYTR